MNDDNTALLSGHLADLAREVSGVRGVLAATRDGQPDRAQPADTPSGTRRCRRRR